MKKKRLLITLTLAAVLLVSFTVFAAASDSQAAKNIRWFFGVDTSKLTDKQKADLNESLDKMSQLQKDTAQKMAELEKEAINKMVANGSMTKEQGDAAIQKIDERLKNLEEKGYSFPMRMGKGDFSFFGKDELDLKNLTDQQKADLKDYFTKMAALQKDAINKMVSDGAITKTQGDAASKKIDSLLQDINNGNYTKGLGMVFGKDGFCFIGINGLNTANLTDQQKADLKGYLTNMANLQKEAVNKMVSDGTITKDQGDAALERINNMLTDIQNGNFPIGFGKGKGHFRNQEKQGYFNKSSNTTE